MIKRMPQNAVFVRQSGQRNAEGAANVTKRLRTGTLNMTTKTKMNRTLNIAMMKVTL
jgi:hypothetical protein